MAANIAQRKNKDQNYFLIQPNGQIGSVMEFDQFFLGVEKSDVSAFIIAEVCV